MTGLTFFCLHSPDTIDKSEPNKEDVDSFSKIIKKLIWNENNEHQHFFKWFQRCEVGGLFITI